MIYGIFNECSTIPYVNRIETWEMPDTDREPAWTEQALLEDLWSLQSPFKKDARYGIVQR